MVTTRSIKRKALKNNHGLKHLPRHMRKGRGETRPREGVPNQIEVIDLTIDDDTTVCVRNGGKPKKHGGALKNDIPKEIQTKAASTATAEGSAACASVGNLRRKSEELIYVKIMNTEHPAYELENPDYPEEHELVWIEWLTTGKKQCINRYQIIKDRLRARKRQQPVKYSPEHFM